MGTSDDGHDRWRTSASEIGRGVLHYGRGMELERRRRQILEDERLALQLASGAAAAAAAAAAASGGDAYGDNHEPGARELRCLPVDRAALHARPPAALPAAQAVSEDLSCLGRRLAEFGLRAVPVVGDGACQFRSLAFALDGSDDRRHGEIRAAVVDHLERERALYEAFVPREVESFDAYLRRMRGAACWGDHLTLQAFADAFGRPVHLVTSYEDRGFIQITPSSKSTGLAAASSGQPLLLGFWAEVHYNPLVFE